MTRVSKLLAAGAVGIVASLSAVAAADASSSTSWSYGGYVRATASWNTSTNNITAGDRHQDGWGAVTPWGIPSAGIGSSCYEGGGDGQTQTCYISASAGRTINYQACAIDNGNLKGCSATKSDIT